MKNRKLRKKDFICFNKEKGAISFLKNDGSVITLGLNMSYELSLPCIINNENACIDIAKVIAATHGLKLEKMFRCENQVGLRISLC